MFALSLVACTNQSQCTLTLRFISLSLKHKSAKIRTISSISVNNVHQLKKSIHIPDFLRKFVFMSPRRFSSFVLFSLWHDKQNEATKIARRTQKRQSTYVDTVRPTKRTESKLIALIVELSQRMTMMEINGKRISKLRAIVKSLRKMQGWTFSYQCSIRSIEYILSADIHRLSFIFFREPSRRKKPPPNRIKSIQSDLGALQYFK